jgi:hypothetical protein
MTATLTPREQRIAEQERRVSQAYDAALAARGRWLIECRMLEAMQAEQRQREGGRG